MSTARILNALTDLPSDFTPNPAHQPKPIPTAGTLPAAGTDAATEAAKADTAAVVAGIGALKAAGWQVKQQGGQGLQSEHTGLFFAPGTVQAESAGEVRRQRVAEWSKIPALALACAAGVAEVARENRRERLAPIAALRTGKDGKTIGFYGKDGWIRDDEAGKVIGGTPTARGWQHIGERIASLYPDGEDGGRSLAGYLPFAPESVRGAIVQDEIARAKATLVDRASRITVDHVADETEQGVALARAKILRPLGQDVKIAMRDTKDGSGRPEVYRVASPGYAGCEPQVVLPLVDEAFAGKGYHAEWHYSRARDRWSLEATVMKSVDEPGRVGEAFRTGFRVRGDDVRSGSVVLRGFVVRERCLNGSELADTAEISIRHTGDVDRILQSLTKGFAGIDAAFGRFATDWARAWQDRIVDENAGRGPAAVFGALYDADLVRAPGGREFCVQNLLRAWEQEPGYSRADVINAVTRAAHDCGDWWNSMDAAEGLEAAGGTLLTVKNLVHTIDYHVAQA